MYDLLNDLFDRLFPLSRSITGSGLEDSIAIIGEHMPFEYKSVPSGTKVFDWTVPKRWDCDSAILVGPEGNTIADLKENNLSVVNYSSAVDDAVSLGELESHLYSLPGEPAAIPYVTGYYKPSWGFCIPHNVRMSLKEGEYRVLINSRFSEGEVITADVLLPGETEREILLSSYICHPSMANNELSGPLVMLGLYLALGKWKRRRYSYRFALYPETIGSLCYLYLNGERLRKNVTAGMVLTCLGGPSEKLSYKMSRMGVSIIDKLADMWKGNGAMDVRNFTPCSGSDERQYCSPGFNMPIGQIARTIYGRYPGYHNSLDNKEFMQIESLVDSVNILEKFLSELDGCGILVNLCPYGEVQLGKRGLYPNVNSAKTRRDSGDEIFDGRAMLNKILMILNYADGAHDTLDIAKMCDCPISELQDVVRTLEKEDLIEFVASGGAGSL